MGEECKFKNNRKIIDVGQKKIQIKLDHTNGKFQIEILKFKSKMTEKAHPL